MMISVLIAGSYTPICLIAAWTDGNCTLCTGVGSSNWRNSRQGILDQLSEVVFFSAVYRNGMAVYWHFIRCFWRFRGQPAFGWLLAGGIIYTVGGVIYSLKMPVFNAKHKVRNMKFSSVCDGWKLLSFYCDVLFCGGDAGIK